MAASLHCSITIGFSDSWDIGYSNFTIHELSRLLTPVGYRGYGSTRSTQRNPQVTIRGWPPRRPGVLLPLQQFTSFSLKKAIKVFSGRLNMEILFCCPARLAMLAQAAATRLMSPPKLLPEEAKPRNWHTQVLGSLKRCTLEIRSLGMPFVWDASDEQIYVCRIYRFEVLSHRVPGCSKFRTDESSHRDNRRRCAAWRTN